MDNRYWYFIGLWLGDGAKDATSITSADLEIIDFLCEFSRELGLLVNLYKSKSRAYEINISGGKISYTRKILKYSSNKEFIEEYNSIKEAASANNIKFPSNISHCCSGKYKNCGGYIWRYGEFITMNPLLKLLKSYNMINNKHIPKDFIEASDINKKYLLAGLIDSDGTLLSQTISITLKYEHIIDSIIDICHSLNYKCCKKTFYINETPYYRVRIKGDLRDLPILLNRKKPSKVSKIPTKMNEYYG